MRLRYGERWIEGEGIPVLSFLREIAHRML